MIATLTACVFGFTTVICLAGWWSATRAYTAIADRYEAALIELWAFKDVVRFAGRCAWHAANDTVTHPPGHLIAPHMVEDYASGYDLERAMEDLATASWNDAMEARA